MTDSRWRMFKNFMHNELGISKDDIREWTRNTVIEVAEKFVAEHMERIVEHWLQRTFTEGWEKRFSFNLSQAVASRLASQLEVRKKEET